MKIAVIGAGAIGSLVAGYLAQKNQDVILVARPEQVAAISKNGLAIEGVRGNFYVKFPVSERLSGAVDLVILATKIQDLEKALEENFSFIKPALVLTVQNGVKAEKLLAQRLDQQRLFASIVMFGATYLSPGKVTHNFEGDWIIGSLGADNADALNKINRITSQAFPSPISREIMGMKWLKLFLNANNCLTAILGQSMQQAFADLEICRISIRIWQEGWRLVNQAGIKLESLPHFPLERLAGLVSMPLEQAAAVFSKIMTGLSQEPLYGSILQSIKRARASEIDYINGEFVDLAYAIKQSAKLNQKLVELVHRVEETKQFLTKEALINATEEL